MTDPPLAKRGKTSATAPPTTNEVAVAVAAADDVDFSLLAAASCLPSLSSATTAELSSFSSFSSTATSTTTTTTTRSPNNNPADFLPTEVICRITCFLDVQSLLRLGRTNHFYRRLCRQNQAGWENLCQTTWRDKIHVCQKAQNWLLMGQQQQQEDDDDVKEKKNDNNNSNEKEEEFNNTTALESFQMAWRDAIEREYILPHEFVFDAATGQGTIWCFRFKESAGADWTSVDPWYQGLPCRQMVFLPDGTVQQYLASQADIERDVWNRPLNAQQQQNPRLANSIRLPDGARLVDPPVPMSWRFLTRPMDLPTRPLGSYVRFTVAGRDVPTYSVRRSPTENWGFIMESCWGLYASFPLPPRRKRFLRRRLDGIVTWVEEDEFGTTTSNDSSMDESDDDDEEEADDDNDEHLNLVFASESEDAYINATTSESTTRPNPARVFDREMMEEQNHEDFMIQDHVMDATETSARQHHQHPAPAAAAAATSRSARQSRSIQKRQRRRQAAERRNRLQDDSFLSITNEVQWREAFLYNVGARVLPEGDEAAAQFDQAWAGI